MNHPRKHLIGLKLYYLILIVILILTFYLSIDGIFSNKPYHFLFGVLFYILFAYLCGIWWGKKEKFIEDLINLKDGTCGIIYGFLFILIVLSIGRLGTVLIYETYNSFNQDLETHTNETFNIHVNDDSSITLTKKLLDDSKNDTNKINYIGINNADKLKVNLLNDYLFFKSPNSFAIGNHAIEQNILIKGGNTFAFDNSSLEQNTPYPEPFNLNDTSSNNIDITTNFTSEINKNKHTSVFGNISLDFIRSEIGRILFLIILINIFSLVPSLLEKNDDKQIKYLFCWDKVPGDDNGRLLMFLKQEFDIPWAETPNIQRIDNYTIRVTTEKRYFSLELNNEKTKVNLIINEIIRAEFITKIENGRLNIYQKENDDKQKENDNKQKKKFFDLILTSLLLSLILTLTPEGDIGVIKLNMSFESAISSFLIIISIILIYYFKNVDVKNWFKKS